MDHGGMDHGGHGAAGPMCSMNVSAWKREWAPQACHCHLAMLISILLQMLFTWDTKNLCIVISTVARHLDCLAHLLLLAILAISIGYEALREGIRRYEATVNKRVETAPRKSILSHASNCIQPTPHKIFPLCVPLVPAPSLYTCESVAKIEFDVVERPKLLLRQPPSSGQDKIGSRLPVGPM